MSQEEQRLLALVALGHTHKEVAAELGASIATVHEQVTRLLMKLPGRRDQTSRRRFLLPRRPLWPFRSCSLRTFQGTWGSLCFERTTHHRNRPDRLRRAVLVGILAEMKRK